MSTYAKETSKMFALRVLGEAIRKILLELADCLSSNYRVLKKYTYHQRRILMQGHKIKGAHLGKKIHTGNAVFEKEDPRECGERETRLHSNI